MKHTYAILGSGRQGAASAYDLIKFGDAEKVLMIDLNKNAAEESAAYVNKITGTEICEPVQADVQNNSEIEKLLKDVDSVISAVPYYFNLELTKAAVASGTNYCDLGGNTEIVRKQLDLNKDAEDKNVTVVPDCGMGPGLNISLIMYALSLVENPEEAITYEGGITQNPVPPWNYELTFHVNGLTNEYFGDAVFLRNGKVTGVKCFEDVEKIQYEEPIGELEAAVTAGGLSTLPWALEGKLKKLENKTMRYPGHWAQFKAFRDLGLFETDAVKVGDKEIIPRDVFHTLLEPKIKKEKTKDYGLIKVVCKGKNENVELDLIDKYDEETGFTSMQRLTGWHASIIAILSAQNKISKGALPVHAAAESKLIVDEFEKRGIKIRAKKN